MSTSASEQPLRGRVALVAGATRGAGRGIAVALGESGATVICTGRSSRLEASAREGASGPRAPFELAGRPETIEETAELVTEAGGHGIAIIADHTDEAQVAAVASRIEADHGRLDVLVNDIWGGDALVAWDRGVDGLNVEHSRTLLDRALWTHILTTRFMAPLLKQSPHALLVEITDGDTLAFRGNVLYDLVKTSLIRFAFALSEELGPHGVTALSVTPGFLRSEVMLEHFGVTAATWREGAATDPNFLHSETPLFVGRGIAALAADPDRARFAGRALSSWRLARTYGFVDADGERPDWGRHAEGSEFGAAQAASHARFVGGFGEDDA